MRKILLIDDDIRYRQSLAPYLESYEFELIEADTGANGVRLLAQTPVSLVIVGGHLPDADGVSVVQNIRKSGSKVPIIFASTHAVDHAAQQILLNELQVSLIKKKPIEPLSFCKEIVGIVQNPDRALTVKRFETEVKPSNLPPLKSEGAQTKPPGSWSKPAVSTWTKPTPIENIPLPMPKPRPSAQWNKPVLPASNPSAPNAADTSQSITDPRDEFRAELPKNMRIIRSRIHEILRSDEASPNLDGLSRAVQTLTTTAGKFGYPMIGNFMLRIQEHISDIQAKRPERDSWQALAEEVDKLERNPG